MKFVVSALFALLLVQASTASSVSYFGSRITDGLTAKPGQFPYQVSIEMGFPPLLPYSHSCGGSIINEYYVLTAAHCASGVFGKLLRYRVKAGMHYLNKKDENVQTVSVAKKIIHEGFPSTIFPKVAPHDIAILKLSSPLTFNDRVKAIVLPVQDSVQSGEVVLSGWGSTSKGFLPKLPSELQYAKIPIVDYDTCKTTIEELKGQLYDTMVCTGPLGGSISACSGDSGGPLVESGSNVQVGIVSWGFLPCGKSGAPSVYTRVSSYVDWINKNIQYP